MKRINGPIAYVRIMSRDSDLSVMCERCEAMLGIVDTWRDAASLSRTHASVHIGPHRATSRAQHLDSSGMTERLHTMPTPTDTRTAALEDAASAAYDTYHDALDDYHAAYYAAYAAYYAADAAADRHALDAASAALVTAQDVASAAYDAAAIARNALNDAAIAAE